jgi:ABC-type transport system involved in multi-copper enzyme maturation permease subunit
MNAVMIRHLVAKDWDFNRVPLAAAMGAGLIALAMLYWSATNLVFYLGAVLLITVVITIGIYLAFLTVIHEHTKGMLPFVMSLPITVREYTAAKLLSNGLLFLLPWAALGVGTAAVILARDGIPDGLLPYATLLLFHMMTGYVLTLAAAIVTGSEGWTIAVAGATNLAFQGFMFWTGNLPDIAANTQGPVAVWSSSVRWLIAAELLAVVVIVAITWGWQARRTDFT